jgi:hypothetical protein
MAPKRIAALRGRIQFLRLGGDIDDMFDGVAAR